MELTPAEVGMLAAKQEADAPTTALIAMELAAKRPILIQTLLAEREKIDAALEALGAIILPEGKKKRGRPAGSPNSAPRKRKTQEVPQS